ncbi:hypothetical protein CW354_20535 [Marinicaulis flavus]|uniref:Uncharacterized protein n=1 Tax=Hyphococcus luteus TaxID=2058213 RepID=A0A2S7JYP6_9PROT|nr:hypothetical protein CW354_20535 [Marinicaulis flavus]
MFFWAQKGRDSKLARNLVGPSTMGKGGPLEAAPQFAFILRGPTPSSFETQAFGLLLRMKKWGCLEGRRQTEAPPFCAQDGCRRGWTGPPPSLTSTAISPEF